MTRAVKWGTAEIPALRVDTLMRPQEAPPIRQGAGGRSDRQGVRQQYLGTLEGGLGAIRGREITRDLTRFQRSDGIITHIPNLACLPYVVNQETEAPDISSYRAANVRVTSMNSTLGQSKLRFHAFVGSFFFRNVSDSDASIESVYTEGVTISAGAEIMANSTRYLGWGCTTGGAALLFGMADPTSSPPSTAVIYVGSSGDWIGAIIPLPNLGPGFTAFYGKIGGVKGLFYLKQSAALATAPSPVVIAGSKDVPGSLATVTTSAKSPTWAADDESVGGDVAWTNESNVLASDNSRATASLSSGQTTSRLIAGGFFSASDVPSNAIVTGISVGIERSAAENPSLVYDEEIIVRVGGNTLGNLNRATTASAWPAANADATATYGASTDNWGEEIHGSDLSSLAVGIRATAVGGSGTPGVDHVTVTVTYRLPGTIAVMPLGGTWGCWDPSDLNSCYIRAPEFADDPNAINVPRILWRLTFAYDAGTDRPVVTLAKVRTGMAHVEDVCIAQGAVLISGDTVSGRGKILRVVRGDGSQPYSDAAFGSNGQGFTEDWGITALYEAGRFALIDVVTAAGTTVQTWMLRDDTYHAITKRETISALPIPWAGAGGISLEPALRRRYRFTPTSGDTLISRSFQPRNMMEHPLYNNTAEVKEDGPIEVILPEMDAFGPEESDKALLTIRCLSRNVSASNTIAVYYSTDAGSSYTLAGTFTSFMSKITLSTPVALRTLTLKFALNHTASSTGTPDALPILLEGTSKWGPLRRAVVLIDPASSDFVTAYSTDGMGDLWDSLAALQASDVVQTLQYGSWSFPATWEAFETAEEPQQQLGVVGQPVPGTHRLVFEEVPQ